MYVFGRHVLAIEISKNRLIKIEKLLWPPPAHVHPYAFIPLPFSLFLLLFELLYHNGLKFSHVNEQDP